MSRPHAQRLIAHVVLATALILALEGLSYLGIWAGSRSGAVRIRRKAAIYEEQTKLIKGFLFGKTVAREELDPVLGWRYRASFRRGGDVVNAQRLRSTRDYSQRPLPGVTRVAAFGDSFVYGNEVDTRDAWPSQIETLAADVEILNYGVGGFGVDQAYLRYMAEGHALAPQTVVMGFVADDLGRLVNVYRRFFADNEVPLAKPRFALGSSGSLQLLPVPLRDTAAYVGLLADPSGVRALGKHDHWYEPAVYENPLYDYSATIRLGTAAWISVASRYFDDDQILAGDVFNRSSTAYRLQLALFERFAAAVAANGARPLIVLFPDRLSLRARMAGRPAAHAPLASDLERLALPHVDLTPAFLERAQGHRFESLFMPGGHYSPEGNTVAARAILAILRGHSVVAAP